MRVSSVSLVRSSNAFLLSVSVLLTLVLAGCDAQDVTGSDPAPLYDTGWLAGQWLVEIQVDVVEGGAWGGGDGYYIRDLCLDVDVDANGRLGGSIREITRLDFVQTSRDPLIPGWVGPIGGTGGASWSVSEDRGEVEFRFDDWTLALRRAGAGRIAVSEGRTTTDLGEPPIDTNVRSITGDEVPVHTYVQAEDWVTTDAQISSDGSTIFSQRIRTPWIGLFVMDRSSQFRLHVDYPFQTGDQDAIVDARLYAFCREEHFASSFRGDLEIEQALP